MRRIVFATNNEHKLQEVREILGHDFEVVSLREIGCDVDIPETGNTIKENARQKAQYVYEHFHIGCFADDTGLEVEALRGAPGVHSARYAEGYDHDSEENMRKLLRELEVVENRKARFRTVIALIEERDDCSLGNSSGGFAPCSEGINDGSGSNEEWDRESHVLYFEGIVEGHIAKMKRGKGGFGYDPIFIPEGYDQSFAELGEDIKNSISHRARAIKKLARYLKGE